MRETITFNLAKERLKNKFPHLVLKSFTKITQPIEIFCKKHKVLHTYRSFYMLKGCPECAREVWRKNHKPLTIDNYKQKVKKGSKNTIKVLGEYINIETKILHLCTKCNTENLVTPKSMLMHFGCKNCGRAKAMATASTYDVVKLGNRKVKVQGGEKEALKFIIKNGIKPKDIVVGSEGLIKGVFYNYKNKMRMYRPDFLIKSKVLVEVKSIWYFGLKNKDYYETLQAKAKACVKEGYRFRVIIANIRKHKPILLPEFWYVLTYRQFQKFWIDNYSLSLNGCKL